MSTVSAEIVFRLKQPLTPRQMATAIYRALGPDARGTLVGQGAEIRVVCTMGAGSRIDEDVLEVVSVEAEPVEGTRY